MFDNDVFWPSPKDLIAKMVEPLDLRNKIILEPQAGAGHILDYLVEDLKYPYRRFQKLTKEELNEDIWNNTFSPVKKEQLYAIELDGNLQHVLHGKNYRVIHNDFLTYSSDYLFDVILMNPPFVNGDKHLMKAWDIMVNGDIVCILNSETIRNPYTQRRQDLGKLIEKHGSVEHIGPAFWDAERETAVEVCIVRLHKVTERTKFSFDFERVTTEAGCQLNEDALKSSVAMTDVISNILSGYDATKAAYVEFMKAKARLLYYGNPLLGDKGSILAIAETNFDKEDYGKSYNGFMNDVKAVVWSDVLRRTEVEKYMTQSVRDSFKDFGKAQGTMDLTRENINRLVMMIFENRVEIMEKAIVEVFDMFTQYADVAQNRYLVSGWKTNDHWKVNKKVILPNWVYYDDQYCSSSYIKDHGCHYKTKYNLSDEYSDIDKVMCYITGKPYEETLSIRDALDKHFDRLGPVRPGQQHNTTCESDFFKIRFFKKGTIHIEFKDEFLWQEFNMRATSGKNWLPEAEKRKWEAETKGARPEYRPQFLLEQAA